MSMMSRAAAQSASAGSLSAILRWVAGWPRVLILHWYRRAAIKSLQELDDRALRDIGLMRRHIEAAVKGDFRRRGG